MDHAEVNGRFVGDLLALRSRVTGVLDVGTGTAQIPIELVRTRADGARDGDRSRRTTCSRCSRARTSCGRSFEGRITLEKRDAKSAGGPDGKVRGTSWSNTILHHIPESRTDLIREDVAAHGQGRSIFLRDLARPSSVEEVRALVRKYGGAPTTIDPREIASHARQLALFEASLHAALTLGGDEGRGSVRLGIPAIGRADDERSPRRTLAPGDKP